MPYSNKRDVEFWGQIASGKIGSIGPDYNESIQQAIAHADHMIDDYCHVPEGFFNPGGIEIQQEYLNGTDVAYLGGITKFFNWYYGGTSHLRFKYRPVLSVTKLEEETAAGTWTTRTEGTGNDYIVVEDGVRYVTNTPAWKYKNVRATYLIGYATTPGNVTQVSARLAAAILHRIIDAKDRVKASVSSLHAEHSSETSLGVAIFTPDLQRLLEPYRRSVYAFA